MTVDQIMKEGDDLDKLFYESISERDEAEEEEEDVCGREHEALLARLWTLVVEQCEHLAGVLFPPGLVEMVYDYVFPPRSLDSDTPRMIRFFDFKKKSNLFREKRLRHCVQHALHGVWRKSGEKKVCSLFCFLVFFLWFLENALYCHFSNVCLALTATTSSSSSSSCRDLSCVFVGGIPRSIKGYLGKIVPSPRIVLLTRRSNRFLHNVGFWRMFSFFKSARGEKFPTLSIDLIKGHVPLKPAPSPTSGCLRSSAIEKAFCSFCFPGGPRQGSFGTLSCRSGRVS